MGIACRHDAPLPRWNALSPGVP